MFEQDPETETPTAGQIAMDRVTWDAVLARLDDALALCHRFGLGKAVAASRFIEYRRVVTGLVTALHDGGKTQPRGVSP